MRQVISSQPSLASNDIGSVQIDFDSRDDIPKTLRGLQEIYRNQELREQVFSILAEVMPKSKSGNGVADAHNGRPGMDQWMILVLGVLRLSLNEDYDRIHYFANQVSDVRAIMGVDPWGIKQKFSLQAIKDNTRLFTPEILGRINQAVVRYGHAEVGETTAQAQPVIAARCDSFVVKTNVHFPTDTNLLWDSMRKAIKCIAKLLRSLSLTDWRQSEYHLTKLKNALRLAQKLKHSTSRDQTKQEAKKQQMREAFAQYLSLAQGLVSRVQETLLELGLSPKTDLRVAEIEMYLDHAIRQINQIDRRVLKGEVIPHDEKVFSIFQRHTEWISKGKVGVPQELGLRVCVVEDQFGFILNHQVMQHCTDDAIAVSITRETQNYFGNLGSISMDKGFHSPANQEQLKEIVDVVVMPKKGRRNAKELEREHDPEFIRLRHKHSAVESAINALNVHGLDRCPDHGIVGFERYVAMAVLARNIHQLGSILLRKDAQRERKRLRKAA